MKIWKKWCTIPLSLMAATCFAFAGCGETEGAEGDPDASGDGPSAETEVSETTRQQLLAAISSADVKGYDVSITANRSSGDRTAPMNMTGKMAITEDGANADLKGEETGIGYGYAFVREDYVFTAESATEITTWDENVVFYATHVNGAAIGEMPELVQSTVSGLDQTMLALVANLAKNTNAISASATQSGYTLTVDFKQMYVSLLDDAKTLITSVGADTTVSQILANNLVKSYVNTIFADFTADQVFGLAEALGYPLPDLALEAAGVELPVPTEGQSVLDYLTGAVSSVSLTGDGKTIGAMTVGDIVTMISGGSWDSLKSGIGEQFDAMKTSFPCQKLNLGYSFGTNLKLTGVFCEMEMAQGSETIAVNVSLTALDAAPQLVDISACKVVYEKEMIAKAYTDAYDAYGLTVTVSEREGSKQNASLALTRDGETIATASWAFDVISQIEEVVEAAGGTSSAVPETLIWNEQADHSEIDGDELHIDRLNVVLTFSVSSDEYNDYIGLRTEFSYQVTYRTVAQLLQA